MAGEKQVTSEAQAHASSHRHWAVLAEMAACQFVNHLTHEKIADNQFQQCLCHSEDIDFNDDD